MEEDGKNIASIIGNIDKWVEDAKGVKEILKEANSDELLALLDTLNDSNSKSWIIQSDILRFIHDTAGKYKNQAIESVAKEINLSRSYCFTLLKINTKIFDEAEDLRNAPNLTATHFALIVNNLKRIEDPIGLLREASDHSWSTSQMKVFLSGKNLQVNYTLQYFKLENAHNISSDANWAGVEKFSSRVNILTAQNGDKYLELKTFNKTKKTT